MKIVLTGGTGFIGAALVKKLTGQGNTVVLLTRNASAQSHLPDGVVMAEWDGKTVGPWAAHVDGADAILNFAGEPIAGKRWTRRQKDRILTSRTDATEIIVEAIRRAAKKPAVLVNASAVGFYGTVEVGDVSEEHHRGVGFLPEVCDRWEQKASSAGPLGVRVVILRIGIVLGRGGGALGKMLLPFKMFVGGPIGSGRQWFPWVHRDDLVSIVHYALENKSIAGPVNIAAPESVTMRQFCAELGKAMRRPSWAPVPGFVLRLALGEMAEMLLTGQKVLPAALERAGYQFKFPNLETALQEILG